MAKPLENHWSNLRFIPEKNNSGQWCFVDMKMKHSFWIMSMSFKLIIIIFSSLQSHNFIVLHRKPALLKFKKCSLWTAIIQQKCDWLTSGPITSLISAPLLLFSAVNQCSRTGITWWVLLSTQRPLPLLDPPSLMSVTLSCNMFWVFSLVLHMYCIRSVTSVSLFRTAPLFMC